MSGTVALSMVFGALDVFLLLYVYRERQARRRAERQLEHARPYLRARVGLPVVVTREPGL